MAEVRSSLSVSSLRSLRLSQFLSPSVRACVARFVQNFLKAQGEEQVAILKQAQSYLYLTHNRLYYYASDDNGAPHLQESEGGVTTSLSSGAPSQILSLPSQLPSLLSSS